MTNPYEPPRAYSSPSYGATNNRTAFTLAAIGAFLASAYWAALTLLIGVGVATGSGSLTSVFFPCVLIVLYAMRGYQLLKGDPQAAQRILWLHGVGALVAIMQMTKGADSFMVFLQSIKVFIHLFGGVAAFFARRAYAAGPTPRG
jgi:hypothetical protein